MNYGCICRDPRHPNPGCLQHGTRKGGRERDARTPAGSLRRKASMKRGAPIADKSIDQIVSDAVQNAIKTERIRAMIEGEGHAWCEVCEKNLGTTVAAAKKRSSLHHQDVRRDEGKGYDYRTGNFRRDDPEGQLVVCEGRNSCHDRLEKEAGAR